MRKYPPGPALSWKVVRFLAEGTIKIPLIEHNGQLFPNLKGMTILHKRYLIRMLYCMSRLFASGRCTGRDQGPTPDLPEGQRHLTEHLQQVLAHIQGEAGAVQGGRHADGVGMSRGTVTFST